jgi:hypothetical protein
MHVAPLKIVPSAAHHLVSPGFLFASPLITCAHGESRGTLLFSSLLSSPLLSSPLLSSPLLASPLLSSPLLSSPKMFSSKFSLAKLV